MPTQIRILITISELVYSSQVRNLQDLVSLLDRDRFHIEVGALATGDEAQEETEALGVKVFRLRLQPTRRMSLRASADLLRGPFAVARKQYDLVHSLLYQSIFTEALVFRYFTHSKYIYTKSNLEWENHPLNWRWKSRLADRIVSISGATDDLLDAQGFGQKKAKIFLGIDTAKFVHSPDKLAHLRHQHNLPRNAVVFGCAAQFVEWKEHLTVLRAFEIVAQRDPNVFLVYCGPNHGDSYYASFRAALEASPCKDRVRLLGRVKDMSAFYSAIDVFVLPSRFETFGYVYVEAMSCSVPVIACPAAGPLEIIDEGVTGRFARMSDATDLAQQMGHYSDDAEARAMHGVAARRRVTELFSKEIMVRNTESLYLETLGVSSP